MANTRLDPPPQLSRRLGLPLLVLYGIGITVGAGIYVLIGAVAGYIQQFIDLSQPLIAIVVVLIALAVWGILESVLLASLFTLVEVGGLLLMIAAALYRNVPFVGPIAQLPPTLELISGIALALRIRIADPNPRNRTTCIAMIAVAWLSR
jgi:uncharacterized membrane protein